MSIPSSRVTINDVARLAGVSKKTVSRVINRSELLSEATRAKVQAVIDETGFVPNAQARALALRHNFLIALIHDGSEPDVLQIAQASIGETLAPGDYALALHALRPADTTGLNRFLGQHRPAGVILLPPLSQEDALVQACQSAGVRCARLGWTRDGQGIHAGDREAMAQTVAWLIEQGHSRIGLVGGPDDHLTAQARELGYLDALADHDLDRGPALIANGDMSIDSGARAGALLLSVSPAPSAIIACNDAMAAGVLQAAAALRIAVPQRLTVIGFDDCRLSHATVPALTSVHVPWAHLARQAVLSLLGDEGLRVEAEESDTVLPKATVNERGTSAPPFARLEKQTPLALDIPA